MAITPNRQRSDPLMPLHHMQPLACQGQACSMTF
eukprot:CAMPEP_0174287786 /NCGR_PEP_ID=MMETSP0809-20121228/17602_1 /TAXON_ID=73025 ORGANISM="Eutreptiella gymnastica-like, Strain CCMP1594" /NCGR_SAMPLE_ID=MMETSP0809 /ASSEMBLY_ACC=CAM_ASM_000658 /LENGTH=33 /DNA_ID= /DNA_START= /DNA_END= /DNA_ORIENTATION=